MTESAGDPARRARKLVYVTKGHLELDWDGCVIRVAGEMTVRPDGFEVFDDLAEPVRVVATRNDVVSNVPVLSEVCSFVRQQFVASSLTLHLRSDRLRT
jgi:hypothetical protein